MEFRQLKTFTTVAKLLSFTKAAAALGYAQSSVTSQIQALEEEFQTKFFERLGRQIKLTKDGEELYNYSLQILQLSEEAKSFIASGPTPKGSLTIATAESLCLYRLPEIFNFFRAAYPEVKLNLNFEAVGNYQSLLRKNSIDIAFFPDIPCREQDFIAHIFCDEPMALIAAPNHPLATKDKITPCDLQEETVILTPEGCTYRKVLETILAQSGIKPSSIMSVNSNEVIKRFVCDHWGIGFLPYLVIQQELAAKKLIALPWAGPDFGIKTQLIYHKNKWLSPALKAFIQTTLKIKKEQKNPCLRPSQLEKEL